MDYTHIYDFVDDLYCKDNGRPSVDPVVLFKIVLLQHIYGIPSLRQTLREVEDNIAFRWFLGYCLNESVPHFSTVSYNFLHRFKDDTIERVFRWILYEIESSGYLSPEMVFIDATHVKANANIKKKCKREIPKAAYAYEQQLLEEINVDREKHGKNPFDDNTPEGGEKKQKKTVSTTDPDSGVFRKGEHKMCFAYGAHTACDKHNFVLGVEVSSGNVHDSVMFDPLYERVIKAFPQAEVIVMDAGYRTPWICKRIIDDGRLVSLPYKRPLTKKDGHEWYKYVEDEYYDCVICPEYKTLPYATTNRDGYREYKSRPYICKDCPTRHLCTDNKRFQKTVQCHIWQEYLEIAEDIRHSDIGKDSYALRKQTIERVFADAKEKHGMRYTRHKGLAQVTGWIKMKYAAMNLKKLALWKAKDFLFALRYFSRAVLE
jgi:transposase